MYITEGEAVLHACVYYEQAGMLRSLPQDQSLGRPPQTAPRMQHLNRALPGPSDCLLALLRAPASPR